VAELTSGHRVTLTYNLYTVKATLPRSMSSIEVESFPLYWEVKAALANKAFLAKGGTIGFFCNHFYAPNNFQTPEVMQQGLKSIGMVVYAASRELDLRADVRPVMDKTWYTWGNESEDESISEDEDENHRIAGNDETELEGKRLGFRPIPPRGTKSSNRKKDTDDASQPKGRIAIPRWPRSDTLTSLQRAYRILPTVSLKRWKDLSGGDSNHFVLTTMK
jgi:hypothetical protein